MTVKMTVDQIYYSVTVFLGDNFFALVQPGMLIRVTALSLQNQAPHRQTKNINTIFLCREIFTAGR